MCRCLANIDPDSVFAYNTVKVVRVKDRLLGALRFFFLGIVFIYIIVKVLYIDQGYNAHDTPIGAVRTSLQYPQVNPVDLTKEVFCPNSPNHANWPYEKEKTFPCNILDAETARFPADETNGIFITTRMQYSSQTYRCGEENTSDNPTKEDNCMFPYDLAPGTTDSTRFLGGIVNYTLGIQHSFYAPQFASDKYAGSSKTFSGSLINVQGRTVKSFPPATDDTPDVISVGDMLHAAGVDLSRPSKNPANSLYYSGIVVLVLVRYDNDGGIKYSYSPQVIPGSDYKLYETRWDGAASKGPRTLIKRAGPKFIFMVSGDFSQFDFQTLLVQMVSALGLLSIASLVVEYCMLYMMPLRKYYSKAKYEDTEDFSHVRGERQVNHQGTALADLNSQLIDIRETGASSNENSVRREIY